MHPAAWSAWVFLVMVVALATTNPLYLGIVLLSVLLAAVLSPRTGTGATSFRALLVFGAAMMVVSVVIATVNGSYGDHTLLVIPGPDLPNWLGGLRLGGPVTAEGLIWATVRGLVLDGRCLDDRGPHARSRPGTGDLHDPGNVSADRLAVPGQAIDEGGAARGRSTHGSVDGCAQRR